MTAHKFALSPSSVLAFSEALTGPPGSLDGWLECNNEAEVRAHVIAYADSAASEMLAVLQSLVEGYYGEEGLNLKAIAEAATAAIAKAEAAA